MKCPYSYAGLTPYADSRAGQLRSQLEALEFTLARDKNTSQRKASKSVRGSNHCLSRNLNWSGYLCGGIDFQGQGRLGGACRPAHRIAHGREGITVVWGRT